MSNRFTEKAERALNNAIKLAEDFGHTYIGSEHILLSLSKEEDSTAGSILKKHGNKQAIINLGGNVYAYGEKANKADWKIGVQNPLSTRGEYLGIASVKNKTVVTSGTYERYFEQDGVIYHHILDPQTGYPVENNLLSVTIITDSSMAADALSTISFALGVEEGLKLIESIEGTEALYVTEDKELYSTSGFLDHFELTDESFTIVK